MWFQLEEAWPGWEGQRGGPRVPHPPQCVLPLQILGFFKGMSFPIASIAVVNSVLFGVYSNALLVLTATSHHERRLQPPSYTHVFIAGCTGGFLQVRMAGACAHAHAPPSADPQLQAMAVPSECERRRANGSSCCSQRPGLAERASHPAGLEGRCRTEGAKAERAQGVGGGDGAERTP